MSGIGFYFFGQASSPEQLPLLTPRVGTTDELLVGKIVRAKAVPDATRAAKVRDTRFRTVSSAGKDHHLSRIDNQVSYFVGKSILILIFHRLLPERLSYLAHRPSSSVTQYGRLIHF
jgi:hypothetical protein